MFKLDEVAFGNDTFVATASGTGRWSPYDFAHDPGYRIFTSRDGVTWKPRKSISVVSIAYLDNRFFGLAPYYIFVSSNGIKWEKVYSGPGSPHIFTYGTHLNNTFVVMGRGIIATSRDGKTWSRNFFDPNSTYSSAVFTAVAFGNDRFIVVGTGGLILQSDPVAPILPTSDLNGNWVSLTQTCMNTKKGIKCKIKGQLNIRNAGNEDTLSSFVRFYLSDNNIYDEDDIFLKQVSTGKIQAGMSKRRALSYSFPAGETISDKYIIAVIDADHTVAEIDENNNDIVYGPIP